MTLRRVSVALAAMLLATLLSGCFESPPRIIALQPARGSVGVPADAPIVVQFDRPVVPQTLIGRFQVNPAIASCDLTQAFAADPAAPCHVVWGTDDTGFTLEHPRAVMQSDQQYTFTLEAGFSDPQGVANTEDHHWTITTEPAPQVRGLSPPDGATSVPADSPMVVDFSTTMDPASTEAAISLSPAIPGTRVAPSRDLSRYLLLPGRPLIPGATYRLQVAASALDDHGERLQQAVSSTFTAGGMTAGDHAVLLLAEPGEPASQVAVALLESATTGDPLEAETVLTAPRCTLTAGCGAASDGSLLYAYVAAALSPDASWLAVVEEDLTAPGAPLAMVVLDPATGAVQSVIQGASLPSWSHDSSTVAFADGDAVEVYQPRGGPPVALPPGDPLNAAPQWGPRDELLVLSTRAAGAGSQVELADAVILVRYAVPGLSGAAADPVLSPDATQLAVTWAGSGLPGTWLVSLGTAPGTPRRLDPQLTPLGWLDTGTLLGSVANPDGSHTLVAVTVSTGDESTVPITLDTTGLASFVVAPSGRLVGYLAPGPTGREQAVVENADGSEVVPIGLGSAGAVAVTALSLS
jgi:Bacterial Ig-like domain